MSKQENVNMVWLSGKLKFDPKVYDQACKALLDVGQKSAIPITANSRDEALYTNLAKFRAGEALRVTALIEPYGVKQDDNTWKNGVNIRVTEIKTPIPQRDARTSQKKLSDDDIPF